MPENCNFNSVPLSQSQEIRTPRLFSVNYTNQDFWSLKPRLMQYIEDHFGNQFNDFVESDLAILLIENWAYLADMLSFKMDQIVNELFIDTVIEVDNAFRLCKLVGFQPMPPIPAIANFSATLGSLLSTDMVMTTPVAIDVVANNIPTQFELYPADENNKPILDQDIIIPAGSFTNSAIVGVEGRTRTDIFQSTGSQNQTFTLSDSPVIFGSVIVVIDGVTWENVSSFTISAPRREYRTEFNSAYQAFIIFGDNTAGAIPTSGSSINVTYRKGGGAYGNIVSAAVNTQIPFPVPGLSINVPVAFTNYTRAQNGYDGDGINDIKRKLPAYIQLQNRIVTGDDYKIFADQFATPYNGQVGKATAVLRNTGCAGNIIDLFILAQDGTNGLAAASDGLKAELSTQISALKMLTDFVCIKDGIVILVDITIELTADKFFSKFKEEIQTKVQNAVNDFMSLNNWDYGQTLKNTDIAKAISSVREISQSETTFTTNDPSNGGTIVTAQYYQIIRPDTINITISFE